MSKEYARFRPLVDTARQLLQSARQTTPQLGPLSPARLTFDPEYPRVLISQIPLYIIELPEQDKVWNKLTGLLDSLEQLSLLMEIPNLSVWNVNHVFLHSTIDLSSIPRQSAPFKICHRNHINVYPMFDQPFKLVFSVLFPVEDDDFPQTAIHDRGVVLNKYTQKHVLDCFFMEGLQVSYDTFIDSLQSRWLSPDPPPLAHIERTIAEAGVFSPALFLLLNNAQSMIGRLKSHWYNPARRRRYCMKSLFDWHDLYALIFDIQKHLDPVVRDCH